MRETMVVMRRELRSYFVSPIGYVVGALMVGAALFFGRGAIAQGTPANATGFFFATLESFPGVHGRIDSARLEREVLVTGPFASRAGRVTTAGALLVGDAADFFDPFTGQGIIGSCNRADPGQKRYFASL